MLNVANSYQAQTETALLSASGGGLLGVIPAAMLMRYEELGQQVHGHGYRLSDSFDSVAGTSTGAVIAAGVALGLTARDIADFYLKDAPLGFRRRTMAIPLLHDLLDGDLMETFFERRTQGRLLERSALKCDLTILTKDLSRGKPVAFTTVQNSRTSLLGVDIRRDQLPLARLLRASTAAPGLFSPVSVDLEGIGPITLSDGGFSPFNDPAFLLTRLVMAGGARNIDLTALGTVRSRPHYSESRLRRKGSVMRAFHALFSQIKDGEALTRQLMADLADYHGADFRYRHHDMSLTRDEFEALGMTPSRTELREMRKIASHLSKGRLFEAACKLAEKTISDPLPLAPGKRKLQPIDTADRWMPSVCSQGNFHDAV